MSEKRIAYIKWIDSIATNGWQSNQWQPMPENEMVCESFGFVYSENDYSIAITTSYTQFGAPMDPLQIPKCAIKEFFEIPYNDLGASDDQR